MWSGSDPTDDWPEGGGSRAGRKEAGQSELREPQPDPGGQMPWSVPSRAKETGLSWEGPCRWGRKVNSHVSQPLVPAGQWFQRSVPVLGVRKERARGDRGGQDTAHVGRDRKSVV